MAELFQAEARELTGSANTRRLRRAGMVPAILYGQGKDVVHLSIPESQVNSAVRNNQPYIQLEGPAQRVLRFRNFSGMPLAVPFCTSI